jgi:hypothetical protein
MSESSAPVSPKTFHLSLDAWAVAAAFVLALLVRTGVLKHVPW